MITFSKDVTSLSPIIDRTASIAERSQCHPVRRMIPDRNCEIYSNRPMFRGETGRIVGQFTPRKTLSIPHMNLRSQVFDIMRTIQNTHSLSRHWW